MGDFTRHSFSIGELVQALLLSDEQIAQLRIIAERSQDAISAIVTDQKRRHEALHRLLESKQSGSPRIRAALKSFKAARQELSATLRAVMTRINGLLDQDQKTLLNTFAPSLTDDELVRVVASTLRQYDDETCQALAELVFFMGEPMIPESKHCSYQRRNLLGILMMTPVFIDSYRSQRIP